MKIFTSALLAAVIAAGSSASFLPEQSQLENFF